MNEQHKAPQLRDPVITTPQELAAALTQRFLDNADTGDNLANSELVRQLAEWKRGQS